MINRPSDKDIGKRVRELRCAMHLTQDGFADLVGISNAHSIARIERGVRGVSRDLAVTIAVACDISLDWLILGRGADSKAVR